MSLQKESEWEKRFDKEMADFPVNTSYFYFDGLDGNKVPTARLSKVKQLFLESIHEAISNREKEIAEEVEKLPRFSAVSIRGGKEMVLKEQVLSILKH